MVLLLILPCYRDPGKSGVFLCLSGIAHRRYIELIYCIFYFDVLVLFMLIVSGYVCKSVR